jgi:hypothetical protein
MVARHFQDTAVVVCLLNSKSATLRRAKEIEFPLLRAAFHDTHIPRIESSAAITPKMIVSKESWLSIFETQVPNAIWCVDTKKGSDRRYKLLQALVATIVDSATRKCRDDR